MCLSGDSFFLELFSLRFFALSCPYPILSLGLFLRRYQSGHFLCGHTFTWCLAGRTGDFVSSFYYLSISEFRHIFGRRGARTRGRRRLQYLMGVFLVLDTTFLFGYPPSQHSFFARLGDLGGGLVGGFTGIEGGIAGYHTGWEGGVGSGIGGRGACRENKALTPG